MVEETREKVGRHPLKELGRGGREKKRESKLITCVHEKIYMRTLSWDVKNLWTPHYSSAQQSPLQETSQILLLRVTFKGYVCVCVCVCVCVFWEAEQRQRTTGICNHKPFTKFESLPYIQSTAQKLTCWRSWRVSSETTKRTMSSESG